MNDKDLRQKVIDQLDWEPSIDSASIAVAVHGGVVTLSGHVPTYLQKVAAERVVRGVKGVLGIAQDIEVRLQGADPTSDEDIAKRAVTAIAFDSLLPPDSVQVKVSHGWITLMGELEWQYQRNAAEADVRKLHGVVGVINGVTLKPRPHTGDIAARIKDALVRDATIDAQAIKVKVDGDRVILEGSVDCWRDRDLVERAAWAAPGVRAVVDQLRVS
jgi:osmotically-inducible protein OsmY